ncbi:type 1 glutamine amidotransferase [Pseudazoarcus pumilus]|uniref:Amidotransferase n=1 Tax=Pseudazoarcus pumilus TaxID=2067960 RepID=A0A2I6S7Q6_9RHOO|nr:type 1 glutamine amidotransferase [Pseudazoarcus pumilus]AUN95277.1 amidotransferase [Pseudazoarcus pumilus]
MKALILQHVPFEGPGSIDDWLAEREAEVRTVRLFAGDALPAPDAADLVVAMGGPMSVNDEWFHEWLADEKRFLAQCVAADRAVIGICLGAQLIASALGATVGPNEHREIGWFDVEAVPAREGRLPFPERIRAFHWHGETFELPPGAERLARSEACENQAFQIGERVIGLQFHLETTPHTLDALLEACGDELDPEPFVQDEDSIRVGLHAAMADNNRLMSTVLEHVTRGLAR